MESIINAANTLTWPGAITICVIAICAAVVIFRLIDKILG